MEYIILITLTEDDGSRVEGLQIPTALEEECRRAPELADLCAAMDGIVGKSAAGAIASLDSVGGVLEDSARIGDLAFERLASADCGARPAVSRAALGSAAGAAYARKTARILPEETVTVRGFGTFSIKHRPAPTRRVVQSYPDTFTYTISDGQPGAAIRSFDPTTRDRVACVDRIQHRLETGDALMLPELVETFDDPLETQETWLYVFRVPGR